MSNFLSRFSFFFGRLGCHPSSFFFLPLLVSADLDLISVTSSGARAASLVYVTTLHTCLDVQRWLDGVRFVV
ncbi:hypothetical protein GE21DRAFT_1044751 [Neurospora crassa]|nr:hypothetical protein GE21DRAFT_1044751 [Neurospora crassa]